MSAEIRMLPWLLNKAGLGPTKAITSVPNVCSGTNSHIIANPIILIVVVFGIHQLIWFAQSSKLTRSAIYGCT